jgi:hypothetical protein
MTEQNEDNSNFFTKFVSEFLVGQKVGWNYWGSGFINSDQDQIWRSFSDFRFLLFTCAHVSAL